MNRRDFLYAGSATALSAASYAKVQGATVRCASCGRQNRMPAATEGQEELFRDAGFPAHVFQTLLVGSDRVEKLIADPQSRLRN